MKPLPFFCILWLFPWGIVSALVAWCGHPVIGALGGIVSFVALAFVLALMRAAKDN